MKVVGGIFFRGSLLPDVEDDSVGVLFVIPFTSGSGESRLDNLILQFQQDGLVRLIGRIGGAPDVDDEVGMQIKRG